MAAVDQQGVHLAFELHGGGGPRTPLLLTHGYGASRRMWDPNVPALAHDRLAITWDMRGHGETDAPEDASLYSHEHTMADMAALLDQAQAERAVLIGMSLGGFMSLSFRHRHPERVAGLVLVDTGPGFRRAEAREGWNAWARQRASELEERGAEALPAGREQRQARHVHGARGLAHAARGMLTQEDSVVFDSLPEIAVPTLVVVGSEDDQFLAAADVMEQRIPGAHKVVLRGAGHAANMDAPAEFNEAVRRFLDDV
ncbi:MAG: alpha/beta fold hydrolase [Solirubrobacteraceae bacterium]